MRLIASFIVGRVLICSHQRDGVHRVRGHDVRVHHRAAGLAPHRDDLLLQENISRRRRSVTGSSVSQAFKVHSFIGPWT